MLGDYGSKQFGHLRVCLLFSTRRLYTHGWDMVKMRHSSLGFLLFRLKACFTVVAFNSAYDGVQSKVDQSESDFGVSSRQEFNKICRCVDSNYW